MLARRANRQGQINSIPQVRVSGVASHLNGTRGNKEVNMLKDSRFMWEDGFSSWGLCREFSTQLFEKDLV